MIVTLMVTLCILAATATLMLYEQITSNPTINTRLDVKICILVLVAGNFGAAVNYLMGHQPIAWHVIPQITYTYLCWWISKNLDKSWLQSLIDKMFKTK